MSTGPNYRAIALQLAVDAVNAVPVHESREKILASIERIGTAVGGALAWHGRDCRLVVLPEYILTGYPMGDTIAGWTEKAALAPGGREYERLGEIASQHQIFLAINAYESDEHFPELYFQASVVLGPAGDVVLRYRRLHSMFSPSPYDVWDRYLDHYGSEAILPVADTEIGRLATIASEEILYPELARSLAMRGAEVFLHSTSEVGGPDLTPKAIARRARALENLAYVVSANTGGISNTALAGDSANGFSEIIDFRGLAIARASQGESVNAATELDLAALRRERRRPAMANLPARVKSQLWAEEYARHDAERRNELDQLVPDRAWFVRRQTQVIERLAEAGVLS